MSTTSTTPKRTGRPAVWGERVQVLVRVNRDLRDHLVARADAIGYKTLSDYLWALLDEGSGYDHEVPRPDPRLSRRRTGHPTVVTQEIKGIAPYSQRVSVSVRVTQDFYNFLVAKAARLGYTSLNSYAWAIFDEESAFDGDAPQPTYTYVAERGGRMTA